MEKKCAEKQEQLLKEDSTTNTILQQIMKKTEKGITEEINEIILKHTKIKELKVKSIEIEFPQKGILESLKDMNLEDPGIVMQNNDPWSGNIYRYSF